MDKRDFDEMDLTLADSLNSDNVKAIIHDFAAASNGVALKDILLEADNIVAIDVICGFIVADIFKVDLASLPLDKQFDIRRLLTAGVVIGAWFGERGKASFGPPPGAVVQ